MKTVAVPAVSLKLVDIAFKSFYSKCQLGNKYSIGLENAFN